MKASPVQVANEDACCGDINGFACNQTCNCCADQFRASPLPGHDQHSRKLRTEHAQRTSDFELIQALQSHGTYEGVVTCLEAEARVSVELACLQKMQTKTCRKGCLHMQNLL